MGWRHMGHFVDVSALSTVCRRHCCMHSEQNSCEPAQSARRRFGRSRQMGHMSPSSSDDRRGSGSGGGAAAAAAGGGGRAASFARSRT